MKLFVFLLQHDVNNLMRLFVTLGFEVEVKHDLTKQEFDRELNDFAQNRLLLVFAFMGFMSL